MVLAFVFEGQVVRVGNRSVDLLPCERACLGTRLRCVSLFISSFWARRDHGGRPFSPPLRAFFFIVRRTRHSHCSSISPDISAPCSSHMRGGARDVALLDARKAIGRWCGRCHIISPAESSGYRDLRHFWHVSPTAFDWRAASIKRTMFRLHASLNKSRMVSVLYAWFCECNRRGFSSVVGGIMLVCSRRACMSNKSVSH